MGVMRSAVFAVMFLFMGTYLLAQSAQNTPSEPSANSSAEPTLPTSLDQIPGIPPGSHPVVRVGQHDRRCWREAGMLCANESDENFPACDMRLKTLIPRATYLLVSRNAGTL